MERRPRWLVALFIAVQVLIPLLGNLARLSGGGPQPFSWHMYMGL